MSRYRGSRGIFSVIASVISAVILVAVVLITVSPYVNLPFNIPTWEDLFELSGLSSEQTVITKDGLSVHYIDVGQADSILIMCDGEAALIDAGENNAGNKILNYLEKQEIDKLKYVIGTHPDSDHIGGMDTVINGIEVENIILPDIPDAIVPTTITYEDVLDAIIDNDLSVTKAVPGDEYEIGQAMLHILSPVNDYNDTNNMSIVTRLTYGENAFVFAGDAEAEAENDILASNQQLKADVLKLGHHGSNTSTTDKWLDEINPTYAVIMVGKDNKYGHPNQETLNKLEQRGIKYYRTDLNGTIVAISDGKNIEFKTEKGKVS